MRQQNSDLPRQEFGTASAWAVAVTIPARNEARRIVPCLEAAATSLKGRGGIVLAVNKSADETVARARAWFEASGATGMILNEQSPPPGRGVGRARRQAVAACAHRLVPGAVIMTTDADSRVAGDWVDANLAELTRADLVCGAVLPDAEEFAKLPATIGRRGVLEGEYMALTLAVRQRLDPVPHDPEPTHLNAAGASLAFTTDVYRDIGGISDFETGEDRAFVLAAERRGWRIRHSARAHVITTCRLNGRTSGGMAGALRARITEADPFVDELLEPAVQTILRARMQGSIRRRCNDGLEFGEALAQMEESTAELARSRLRLSDLHRELPLLAAAFAELEPVAERKSA